MTRIKLALGVGLALVAVAVFTRLPRNWQRPAVEAPRLDRLLDQVSRARVAFSAPATRPERAAVFAERFATEPGANWVLVTDPSEFFGKRVNPVSAPRADAAARVVTDADAGYLRFPEGRGAAACAIKVAPDSDLEVAFERRVPAAIATRSDVPRLLWFEVAEPYNATVARIEDLKLLLSSRLALDRIEIGTAATSSPDQFERVEQRVHTTTHTRGVVLVVLAGSGLDDRLAAVDFRNLRIREMPLRDVLTPSIMNGDAAALVHPCAIAGEQRRALLLPTGAMASFDIELRPDRASLEVGLGVAAGDASDQGEAPVTLRVTMQDGNGTRVVAERTLRPRQQNADALWNDVTLDLARLNPGRAIVQFEAETTAHTTDSVAAFASPVLAASASLPRPSLILISLDTLRADRLGPIGGRVLMPKLRAFADRHTRFLNAYSAAPFTLPSHATMMTGQPPTVHGVERPGTALNVKRSALLADTLARAGYHTAAFTGGGYISYDFGFAHGFDRYSIVDPLRDPDDKLRDSVPRPGDRAFNDFAYRERGLAHVLSWIDARQGQPFFLFLHTYLAHNYSAPDATVREMDAGCSSRLGPAFEPFDADVRAARGESLTQTGEWLTAEDVRHMRNYYDATVRTMDQQIDDFLDQLGTRGLLANAIVVITADHGEEFWEHKGLYHGKTLYEEIVHVPLIFAVPGKPPAVIEAPTSLVDLAPTLLHLLDLPRDARILGAPFPAMSDTEAAADAAILAEVDCQNQAERYMLRTGTLKVIANGDPKKQLECFRDRYPTDDELYDVQADPSEQDNLATRKPELLRSLRTRLDDHLKTLRAVRDQMTGDTTRAMSPETIEMLKKLGYLGR